MHPVVRDLFTRARLTVIAGPCVIESEEICLEIATRAKELVEARGLGFIFKASFDKANRTAFDAFRGPGMDKGLAILERVKVETGVPLLTDIHHPQQAEAAAAVADVLQIPAFLCRQTDLILAAAATGRPTNIKKGQFLAPGDLRHAVHKHRSGGGGPVAVTERGTCFGYHDLVVDMRGLVAMGEACDCAVIFDATHSVQRPGAGDGFTSGDRELAPVLARAAVAVGVDGLYCEVHPSPDEARSDAANSLGFDLFARLVAQVSAIDKARREVAP